MNEEPLKFIDYVQIPSGTYKVTFHEQKDHDGPHELDVIQRLSELARKTEKIGVIVNGHLY